MPSTYLRLRDVARDRVHAFDGGPVRIGRDEALELPVTGAGSEVVSASHARLVLRDGAWWVEDAGGRNGTFVDDARVRPSAPVRLVRGMVIGLGERGPRFAVEAVERPGTPETTLVEGPGPVSAPDATVPLDGAAPPPPLTVVLRNAQRDARFEGTGGRIRVGRGRECELRPVEPGDRSVSRVHCEIVLRPGGEVVLRDVGSRHGTLVNDRPVSGERAIGPGDRIRLGAAGPELIVETLLKPVADAATPRTPPPPEPPPAAEPPPRPTPVPPAEERSVTPPPPRKDEPAGKAAPRRSFGGKGRTVFIRDLVEETHRRSASRVRMVTWIFVALLAASVGGIYWYADRQQRRTEVELEAQRQALLEQQRRADSVQAAALAEVQELSLALSEARQSAAPAAVVDSLRTALSGAQQRTTQLEVSLARAQQAMQQQLAAGDSLRRAAQTEIGRLRTELDRTAGAGVSQSVIDSLRAAVRSAEERAGDIEAGLRAVRGTDLARIARANQGAVGLVSTFAPDGIYDGSGFVISPEGWFVTNRHVVHPGGAPPDSVFVTMADQRTMQRAEVVAVAPPQAPDLAVLRVRNYRGPYVSRVDWDANGARQGEPAALIGFPAGVAAALDQTRTVRTSMSAGIFSKVTPETIQFDGFTVGGSSGSPVFNANGEVVAVHAAGLREAAGLAFTVPVALVLPLLPDGARAALTR